MGRRIACGMFAAFFGIAAFGGITTTVTGSANTQTVIFTVIFSAITVLLIWGASRPINYASRYQKKQPKQTPIQQHQSSEAMRAQRIAEINSMTELPVISAPVSVVLKKGEICHYQTPANILIVKNQVVGHTGGYRGASIRVAKGLTLHTGGSRGQTIRQDVQYKYPGILTITSQRIIMTGDKGFDYSIDKLTSFTKYVDGVGIQFGNKNYTLTIGEPHWPDKILSLIQAGAAVESKLPPIKPENISEIHTNCANADPEIETPDGAELSYLDAEALKFWNKKHTDFVVPQYYSQTAFGRNVGPALKRLINGGYLETGTLKDRIELKTIPELKAILAEKELKTSGNKAELVYRIESNFDTETVEELFPVNIYKITEKGKDALDPYSIISDNEKHALGLSYYRLLSAKKKNPGEENNVILAKMLSDDIQNCYRLGDLDRYMPLIEKSGRFMREIGEAELSFECYSLTFFVATVNHKPVDFISIGHNLEQSGKLCGYNFNQMISAFKDAIKKSDPFALGTDKNIETSVKKLIDSLK